MIHGFLPYHDELYNCLEDVLACIAKGFKREHMLMYANAWNLSFFPVNTKNRIIGNRVEAGEYNAWVCLEKYHGIKSKCHFSETSVQQVEVLRKELEQGNPTVLWLDGFYVPWTNVYKKLHMKHFLIVIDINDADESINVIDPYWNKEINALPMKNFKLSKAKCITFSLSEEEPVTDWHEIVENAVTNIKKAQAFSAMRKFAEEVEHSINIEEEYEGFEELKYNSPIFMQLAEIFFRRLNFSNLLSYLGERNGVTRLIELSGHMKTAGDGWKKARDILIKAIESKEQQKKFTEFANKVRELADYEENLAIQLSAVLDE